MLNFKGAHFGQDIILTCVRWYLAYPLSYRQLEEMMQERGVAVKRVTRSMVGFKSFDAAQRTLTGIELMHMVRKGQWAGGVEEGLTAAEQFYALAA
jgi:transposase-like protein